MRLFKFVCKEGESLVYFDHVLDVVGHGFRLAVDFAHAHGSIAGPRAHVRGRSRPLNGTLHDISLVLNTITE